MENVGNKLPYFLILRPKNLIIIVLTMVILQYAVITPLAAGQVNLSPLVFSIFVLITVLLAGSANLINDIFDYNADLINKPEKTYIEKLIPISLAWNYYYMLTVTGFIGAVYVAWQSQQWYNLWIYPLASWLLFMYAKKWKSTYIFGNIVVSLFVAWVWGILFYAQLSGHSNTDLQEKDVFIELFMTYFVFAFLVNLIREIVKDVEDIEGDKKSGIVTMPVTKGIPYSKHVITALCGIFIILFCSWLFYSNLTKDYMVRFYHLTFITAPVLLVITHTLKAFTKNHFSFISKVLKLVMMFALAGLILLSKNLSAI